MSFILDALKKAESERSRQAGPVLMDVRIAPPRRRLPAWAWVLGGVLLVNLVLLGWLALRAPRAAPGDGTESTATAGPAPAGPAVAATVAQGAVTAAPAALPAAGTVAPAALPPQPGLAGAVPPAAAPAAALPPPALPAPAADFDPDRLPTAQDLQAAGITLPPLQLNLHVYDPAPANRYVLLNGVRLREGEYTPDGMKVERITARGVVLDASSRRFLLPAGG